VKNQFLICVALVFIALVGCAPSAAKLDKPTAETALATFLEAWKNGEKPADLKAKQPSIIAGGSDFTEGRKLAEYKIINQDKSDGSNLHAIVELTIGEGKNVRKRQVTYVVGTSPVITIFPADL